MVPAQWFSDPKTSSVWVSGYRMMRVSPADLPRGPEYFDLSGARVYLLYGTVNYLDPAAATLRFTDTGHYFDAISKIEKDAPEGAYLLLLLPFDVDGKDGDEGATRDRISDVVGLLAAMNQRNMVYEHVFDDVRQVGGTERSVIGGIVIHPMSIPAPDLRDERLQTISRMDAAIHARPDAERSRIRLSLRWFQAALYDLGVDAFLKFWIAIETLVMPDTKNIRPANMALSRLYGIPLETAIVRFNVGRVFGLRSRIVHEGSQLPISQMLLDYLESLYVDLLLGATGQAPEKRVESFIAATGFDPGAYLVGL